MSVIRSEDVCIMVLSPSFPGVRYYQSKDNRTRFVTGLGESGLLRNL